MFDKALNLGQHLLVVVPAHHSAAIVFIWDFPFGLSSTTGVDSFL
jgi:hypothetical protein